MKWEVDEDEREAVSDLRDAFQRLQTDVASALVRWPTCPELVALDRKLNDNPGESGQ